jgi:hypothetical protein
MFVKIHLQGCFHCGTEVHIRKYMLICGKVWREMAHSACAAMNFQMCILHSMVQHHCACVINLKVFYFI